MKRIVYVLIFMAVVLMISIYVQAVRIQAASSVFRLSYGLDLINADNYEKGLDICNKASFGSGTRYVSVIARKIARIKNNETVNLTKEDCDRIPLHDKMPFWSSSSEVREYYRYLESAKKNCLDFVSEYSE